jgi:hypothetical protein
MRCNGGVLYSGGAAFKAPLPPGLGHPAPEALPRSLSLAFAHLPRQKDPIECFFNSVLQSACKSTNEGQWLYGVRGDPSNGVLLPAPTPQRSLATSLHIISRSLSRIGGVAARHSSTPTLVTSRCRPQQQKPQAQELRGRPNISQKRMLRK